MVGRGEHAVRGAGPHAALTGFYAVDPLHSTIGFSVRHAMVANVRGRFRHFEGVLKLDGSKPALSEAYLSVQTASLDTGVAARDEQAIGPDCLDSAVFPLMGYRSIRIAQLADDRFRVSGMLTIKDIELPVPMELVFLGAGQDAYGYRRVGFEGSATLQRSDWGLDRNAPLGAGAVLIGDRVKLVLDVSAVRVDQVRPA